MPHLARKRPLVALRCPFQFGSLVRITVNALRVVVSRLFMRLTVIGGTGYSSVEARDERAVFRAKQLSISLG